MRRAQAPGDKGDRDRATVSQHKVIPRERSGFADVAATVQEIHRADLTSDRDNHIVGQRVDRRSGLTLGAQHEGGAALVGAFVDDFERHAMDGALSGWQMQQWEVS